MDVEKKERLAKKRWASVSIQDFLDLLPEDVKVLDDLYAANEIIRRFERYYGLSSAEFYDLYQQGRLDDGEHMEDFAMWASFYQIKLDRMTVH